MRRAGGFAEVEPPERDDPDGLPAVTDQVIRKSGGEPPFGVENAPDKFLQRPGGDRGNQRQQKRFALPSPRVGDEDKCQGNQRFEQREDDLLCRCAGGVAGVRVAATGAQNVVRLAYQRHLDQVDEQQHVVDQREFSRRRLAQPPGGEHNRGESSHR